MDDPSDGSKNSPSTSLLTSTWDTSPCELFGLNNRVCIPPVSSSPRSSLTAASPLPRLYRRILGWELQRPRTPNFGLISVPPELVLGFDNLFAAFCGGGADWPFPIFTEHQDRRESSTSVDSIHPGPLPPDISSRLR